MQYITAALSNQDYIRFVHGLARSFVDYNNSPLTIYTDLNFRAPLYVNIRMSVDVRQFVDTMTVIHPQTNPRIKLSWAKVQLLKQHIEETKQPTVWLDADMLVTRYLDDYFVPDKINVISYGGGDRIRDCGDGIKIVQDDYAVGAMFGFPDLQTIQQFYDYCQYPVQIPGELNEQAVCEQSALNRFVQGRTDIHVVDKVHHDTMFNLRPWNGHIKQDSPIQDLVYQGKSGWFIHQHPVAIIYFMSHLLPRFIDSDFACIKDETTRRVLTSYYSGWNS